MTRKEAKTLKVGDQIVIWRGTKHEMTGRVAKCHPQGMEFDWDDGEHTAIHPDDMQDVERITVPTTLHGMADIHARRAPH